MHLNFKAYYGDEQIFSKIQSIKINVYFEVSNSQNRSQATAQSS